MLRLKADAIKYKSASEWAARSQKLYRLAGSRGLRESICLEIWPSYLRRKSNKELLSGVTKFTKYSEFRKDSSYQLILRRGLLRQAKDFLASRGILCRKT